MTNRSGANVRFDDVIVLRIWGSFSTWPSSQFGSLPVHRIGVSQRWLVCVPLWLVLLVIISLCVVFIPLDTSKSDHDLHVSVTNW